MGWPQRSWDIRPQRNLIARRGTCVLWEKTAPCTCTPPGEAPDPTCAGCHGTGRVLVGKKVIRGLVTNATQDRTLMQAAWVQDGDLLFSQYPSSCDQLNDFDRIVLIEVDTGEPFMGEKLLRGSGVKDRLTYNIQAIQYVSQTDPDTGVTTYYDLNNDFTFSGRDITWVGGHQPAAKSTYSVQYRANYEYTVVNPPFIRYEGQSNLGQRVILKLRNIQGDENAAHIQTVSTQSVGEASTGSGDGDNGHNSSPLGGESNRSE